MTKRLESKEMLVKLHDSITIVSDYGAVLQTSEEGEFFLMPESQLPHRGEEIVNAIKTIESFIEAMFNDDILKEMFIEKHNDFFFNQTQAEYLLSEKYRESLKSGLAFLDSFVSSEKAEKGKAIKKDIDYMEVKETTEDNLIAFESEDFERIICGFLKVHKKSKK